MPETLFLFDRPEAVHAWSAIDDRVMGGVSRSTLRFDPAGHAVFSGQVVDKPRCAVIAAAPRIGMISPA